MAIPGHRRVGGGSRQRGWVQASYLLGSGAKLDVRKWGLTQADFWNPAR